MKGSAAVSQRKQSGFAGYLKKTDIYKNRSLYAFLLPAFISIILFSYLPMAGIVVAFQKYDPFLGLFASKWVGFDNFRFFFRGSDWLVITVNTLYLNLIFIASGTAAAIIIAIIMTELKSKPFVKAAQTFMTLPNFISWATVALFSVAFLSADGIINAVFKAFGGKGIEFYSNPGPWPLTFLLIRIWKGAGWGAILYMAAILGIDKEIYEAAKIDGAGRMRCIFNITLPLIRSTIILLLILSIGGIFKGDFAMIYPFIGDNALLYPTTDVVDTYLFRALRSSTNMGSNMAVNLYQNILGFILVFFANAMAKRVAPESQIF